VRLSYLCCSTTRSYRVHEDCSRHVCHKKLYHMWCVFLLRTEPLPSSSCNTPWVSASCTEFVVHGEIAAEVYQVCVDMLAEANMLRTELLVPSFVRFVTPRFPASRSKTEVTHRSPVRIKGWVKHPHGVGILEPTAAQLKLFGRRLAA
jgi:hypothetical protein